MQTRFACGHTAAMRGSQSAVAELELAGDGPTESANWRPSDGWPVPGTDEPLYIVLDRRENDCRTRERWLSRPAI